MLVALRRPLPPQKQSAEVEPRLPGPAAASRPPLAEKVDAHGRVRRLYFPASTLAGTAAERARSLLALESPRLGFQRTPPELALASERRSPSGVHLRLQQQHRGVPIWGAEAVVSFDRALRPTVLASDLEDPDALPPGRDVRLDADAARAAALRALGGSAEPYTPPAATLYLRRRDDRWNLEYRVLIPCREPEGDWDFWIDARDGALRERQDRTLHGRNESAIAADGWSRAFLPDPCTATGDPALRDLSDADTAVPPSSYSPVALPELEPPAGGFYRLRGPWVRISDWEAPAVPPDSSPTPEFDRRRSAAGFEDVMAYHHLDAVQRWYRRLGFSDANARQQVVDTHGVYGQDNSKFVPTLHRISYGEGGVDDAEDAGVLVHEYGHATQFDIVPTWGTGGHTGAMGEGFGDYLANSYAWSFAPERVEAWNGVFQWDGHNEYWPGRRVIDPALHYPEDATGPVHRAGTLWCSALTDALYTLRDREVMDRLVLDHHYALTGSATMEDAANAILASDIALYSGAHLAALVEVLARWGFVHAADWSPVAITHTSLASRAAGEGPSEISCRVVSSLAAIDRASVVAHVRFADGIWMDVQLAEAGEDLFAASLVPPGGEDHDVAYWIEAADAAGNRARLPAAAPGTVFAFEIGRVVEKFEADSGWSAVASGDDATSGRWTRAVPVGTSAQPSADHTPGGSACFLTANGLPGANPSDADVDGGRTTLTSPVWDLRGVTGATLTYWRWFSNDQGTSPDEDAWVARVSNDGGATWVVAESTCVSEVGWRRMRIDLDALLGPPQLLRLRFVASDRGAASLVEAAVDDVVLRARGPVADAAAAVPEATRLLPNHPNPCNPATELRFVVASPGPVRLALYDPHGRLVRVLVDGPLASGPHRVHWDGTDAAGRPVASGVYLAALAASGPHSTRKITVLR